MKRKSTVLLYVRPWNAGQMIHLALGVFGRHANLHQSSEHSRFDRTGLAAALIKHFQSINSDMKPIYLTDDECANIIVRCRLLRNLELSTARKLLLSAERAVEEVLDKTQATVMLSLTVDSYILDIFATLCERRGVLFIGIVPSFVNGYFRITARGERTPSRRVSEAEIRIVKKTLETTDYRPDFLVRSEMEIHGQMVRLWLRNLPKPLWFAIKRIKPNERLNYHYWATQIVSQGYWSLSPQSPGGLRGTALAQLREGVGEPLVYLPLQMSPEATIDYWSSDKKWIEYEKFVLALIQQYSGTRRFLVKEHPNLVGYRSRGFYKRLANEANCFVAAPKVASNDLINLCDGVVVCTGTAGFEAALRGKPVFSDSKPYYLPEDAFLPLAALKDDIQTTTKISLSQDSMIEYMLCGTLPGRFLNNGKWSPKNPEHVEWSNTMAQSIREFITAYPH